LAWPWSKGSKWTSETDAALADHTAVVEVEAVVAAARTAVVEAEAAAVAARTAAVEVGAAVAAARTTAVEAEAAVVAVHTAEAGAEVAAARSLVAPADRTPNYAVADALEAVHGVRRYVAAAEAVADGSHSAVGRRLDSPCLATAAEVRSCAVLAEDGDPRHSSAAAAAAAAVVGEEAGLISVDRPMAS